MRVDRRFRYVTVGYFILFSILIGQMGCATAPQGDVAGPELESIQMCKSTDGPKAVDVTDKFKWDDPVIHGVITVKNAMPGTSIKGVMVQEIGSTRFTIGSKETTCKTATTAGERAVTDFSLNRPIVFWSQGNYKLDVYIDGKLAGSAPFRVLLLPEGPVPTRTGDGVEVVCHNEMDTLLVYNILSSGSKSGLATIAYMIVDGRCKKLEPNSEIEVLGLAKSAYGGSTYLGSGVSVPEPPFLQPIGLPGDRSLYWMFTYGDMYRLR